MSTHAAVARKLTGARTAGTDPLAMSDRSHADAVVEVNDAVSEAAFIEELELRAHVASQRALAAADHDRAQEQVAFVDNARRDCLACELGAPDGEVGHRRLLEPQDVVSVE